MLTTYDDIERHLMSPVYMDGVLRPVVLPFWQKPVAVPDNARTHLTRISKNNVVRIDWLVRSSDMSTILTCL